MTRQMTVIITKVLQGMVHSCKLSCICHVRIGTRNVGDTNQAAKLGVHICKVGRILPKDGLGPWTHGCQKPLHMLICQYMTWMEPIT